MLVEFGRILGLVKFSGILILVELVDFLGIG